MSIYIFTEGGTKIGYGHLARCSSLYDNIRSRGLEATLFVSGDHGAADFLGNRNYVLKDWINLDILNSLLVGKHYAIVDSYLAVSEVFKFISKHTVRALYIDDNNRIDYPEGIVTNPSLYPFDISYPNTDQVKYLLGKSYIILREPFLRAYTRINKTSIDAVLITLGGSDPTSMTPSILRIMQELYPEWTKHVVIGNGFSHVEEIKAVKDKNTILHYYLDGSEMRELMLTSDLAITAAGQTVYELIKTQTPFIPIQVADNQDTNIVGLLEYRLINKVLNGRSDQWKTDLGYELDELVPHFSRESLSTNMRECIDGQGVERLIDELII
jgi:UDP-2,4-diacetamido-2,4,6-trideoxy-beta-L-altropyranose hydrolase